MADILEPVRTVIDDVSASELFIISAVASTAGVICVAIDVVRVVRRQRDYRRFVSVLESPEFVANLGAGVGAAVMANLFGTAQMKGTIDPDELKVQMGELRREQSELREQLDRLAREDEQRSQALTELEQKLGQKIDLSQENIEKLIATATGIDDRPVVAAIGVGLVEAGILLGLWASLQ